MFPFLIDLRDIRNIGLYILACVIIPLGWIVMALAIWRNLYTDAILYVGGGLALAGFVGVYWFFARIPPGPREEEIKKKLAERLAAGESLAVEKTEPLSTNEITRLGRLNFILVSLLIVTFGAFAFVSYFPAREMAGDPYTILIPVGLGLVFAFLIYKYSLLLPRAIRKGEKTVTRGIITNRWMRTERRTARFYLVVGTIDLEVGKRDYRTHYVGEAVQIDFLPDFGKMVLKIARINMSEQEFLR